MKKLLIPIIVLLIAGCDTQDCAECVETISTKWYNSNSSVIKSEEDEVVTVICDEQEIEHRDGAFSITEDNFGNLGYYKQITRSTTCN